MARPKKGVNEDKKNQFGIWLGIPVSARKDDEKTMEQFAAKLGITDMTLTRWKNDPQVQEIARSAVKQFFGNDSFEVVKSIVQKAKEGNAQMARLFLEYNGDIGTGVKKKEPPKDWKVTIETVNK